MESKDIWTIGHSTHTIEEFITMLESFNIQLLIDVRHYPGSRRYPHFNKDYLAIALNKNNIEYMHLVDLGGRRKPAPDSNNTAWRHPAFRGYADYMETDAFKNAVSTLESLGLKKRAAYMCSEAVWWRCHRSLISDYLKSLGWHVFHIMGVNKMKEHSYTAPAKIKDNQLSYSLEEDGKS